MSKTAVIRAVGESLSAGVTVIQPSLVMRHHRIP